MMRFNLFSTQFDPVPSTGMTMQNIAVSADGNKVYGVARNATTIIGLTEFDWNTRSWTVLAGDRPGETNINGTWTVISPNGEELAYVRKVTA